MKSLLVLSALLVIANAAKIPEFLQKCDVKLPDAAQCTSKAAQAAIGHLTKPMKELGLPSLEPLVVPKMDIGAGSGPVALEQKYTDVKIFGLTKAIVEKAAFDFDKKIVELAGVFPELKKQATYDFNGKVLLLPIVGKGPSTVIIKNVKAHCTISFEEVEKDGSKFLKLLKLEKVDFDPEEVSFNFENLFDGNKELGDNINKVLNENAREVFEDVRQGYATAFGQILMGLAASFFNKIPANEIFINY